MAILDILKYNRPNDVLVWKWRSESNDSQEHELRMGCQLIVNQSQKSCYYKGCVERMIGRGLIRISFGKLFRC